MSKSAKVLVVDDDPDVLEQLSITLKADGHTVYTGSSQKEAEEMLLSVRPDLAIVDLMMDAMDTGFTICHSIKSVYPGTPVILLTAVTSATGLSFAGASPQAQGWIKADKVLDKPARPEQICQEVRRLLKLPPKGPPDKHHT